MYRMVIVDDDIEFCIRVREIIFSFFERKNLEIVITPYTRPKDLLWDLEDGRLYNIYCIDIKMPDMTGLELAGYIRLKDEDGVIIFLTSYEEYGLEGYQYNACRYIMKGSENEKLPLALEAAVEMIERMKGEKKYYVIEKYKRPTRLCTDDIYYLLVEKKYTLFYTAKGIYRERKPLKDVLGILEEQGFFKLDKSCAVNLKNISEIKDKVVILVNGERLPVSENHRSKIHKLLADYWRRSG